MCGTCQNFVRMTGQPSCGCSGNKVGFFGDPATGDVDNDDPSGKNSGFMDWFTNDSVALSKSLWQNTNYFAGIWGVLSGKTPLNFGTEHGGGANTNTSTEEQPEEPKPSKGISPIVWVAVGLIIVVAVIYFVKRK